MAAVSAPQATGALTPPTTSDGNPSAWDFSVPSRNQNSNFSRPHHEDTFHAERKPMTSHPNGSTRRNDAANHPRSNPAADPAYLAPARLNSLNKNGNASGTDSPSDSLLDLYRSGTGKSASNSIDYGERGREGAAGILDHEDDPGWIHRDKLARIESRELQAAGIILPRTRAYSRRDRSRETSATGLHRNEQHPVRHQRVESPPAEELEDDEPAAWDPRTPEEIAADNNSNYRDYGSLSKGSSKIPLALTSPAPVPWEYLERDAPMQRSRSAVWGGEDDTIAYPRVKASSEEPVLQPTQTPSTTKRFVSADSSPKKSANSTPTARKMSSASASAVSKPPITQSQKPKTRSGSNSRPQTRSGEMPIKTPEGDPPWLASMYKPDPRLPPDQQILPTVARRLQQEQWEKEGKFGNMYDREFRPLNDEEIKMPEVVTVAAPEEPEMREEDAAPQWPLRKARSPEPSRPGTAGGYSTVPRIQTAPPSRIQSPKLAQQPFQQFEPVEAPEKKGCGCCVVM